MIKTDYWHIHSKYQPMEPLALAIILGTAEALPLA